MMVQAKQIWQVALSDLEHKVSRANFETWLRSTQIVDFEDDTATIGAPNSFAVEQLRNKFAVDIQKALSIIVGRPVGVDFEVLQGSHPPLGAKPRRTKPKPPPDPSNYVSDAPLTVDASAAQQLELTSKPAHGLNPKYVFEKLVVGANNRLAHAAAQAVAEEPAQAFNPLFVYGGVGLGKTHLLHAIGHRALSKHPEMQIRYVSSETFMNELINAIRQQNTEAFRDRYRTIDILMIDDIQFIAGKESTQEEFFHTFNALHSAGKQIVISSDRSPRSITTLHDRLRSRFEGGLIADVSVPDFETRQAILAEKGRELGVELPWDVLEYVANNVDSNIRELEGALNKITVLGRLHKREISMEVAVQALNETVTTSKRRQITPEEVVDSVIGYYKVSPEDIRGKGRRRDIVVPRQVAMYLIREETDSSLVEIGQQLGGRDHSTIVHGIEKVEKQIGTDPRLRNEVIAIREILYTSEPTVSTV